jgi:uncharacterized protein (TIGR00255 family)
MAKSMTAFANAESIDDLGQIRFEMRSVNHRFLELGIKLPEELRALEPSLREHTQKLVQRGKVDLYLRFKAPPSQSSLTLNADLVEGLLKLADDLHNRHPELKPLSTANVLAWPGAVQGLEQDGEKLRAAALRCFQACLHEFDAARSREGDKLTRTLLEKVAQLSDLRTQALTLLPEIRNQLKEKMQQRLSEFKENLEPNRLEAELVMHLNKLDVDEEMERLRVHLLEANRVLSLKEPVGRRLDFLVQELHRECNTFGAKSIDARTSQISVDMKVLVEQIREQVQNLE